MFWLISSVILIAMIIYYYVCGHKVFRPETIAGKRVLVTGASAGIGEQIAYYYSRLGAKLVIVARREELLRKVAIKCANLGAEKVHYVIADLAISHERVKLIKEVESHLGGLDILILNHALLTTYLWTGNDEDMETLKNQMNVNFISYVDIASKCVPMLKKSKGTIGVVSSGSGKLCFAFAQSYSATKFALQGFFGCWRQELQQTNTGISVTIAVLGFINTDTATGILRRSFPDNHDKIPAPADVKEAAAAIVRAVAVKTNEIYFPLSIWVLVQTHKFFADLIDYHGSKQLMSWYKK